MYWFIDPIRDHYSDFEGRVGRQEFWMYILGYFLVAILISVFDSKMLSGLLGLGLFLPTIGLTARRLHDIGRSGWWQLIGIIPLIGLIVMIVWLTTKSDLTANIYGEVPLSKDGSGNQSEAGATETTTVRDAEIVSSSNDTTSDYNSEANH